MNVISTYILLGALFFTATGCTQSMYQPEDEHNGSAESVSTGDILFDHTLQRELGYPRIEHFLSSYEQTIKRYANRYGFDWRLILAVMNQESRFRSRAVSPVGAYGLMQIMPATGRDITTKLLIDNVNIPENNIAGGVFYLWWVYKMFHPGNEEEYAGKPVNDRLQLALAAYNGGPTRVSDAQSLARYLNLDPYRWENIKVILPMLSHRYSTLHHYVWVDGKPAGGYFYGWPETVNYVDSVMEYYAYYKIIFE